MKQLFTILLFTLILNPNIQGQCMLRELSLEKKIQAADLIIEAKVIDKFSFWNNDHTRIYTSNKLEIYKIFQGQVNQSEVVIITEGGTVGPHKHTVQPGLELEVNEAGVFFIKSSKSAQELIPYGGVQGFIQYDKEIKTASDPFRQYQDIRALYAAIVASTGSYSELKQLKPSKNQQSGLRSSVTINSFSPSSLTGGTETQLTIDGSGFGNTQGATAYVEFRDANDGGSSFYQPKASQYVSWSDNQIIVNVPARAGTGSFRVRNGSSTLASSGSLTVTYSHLNATTNDENVFQTSLIDKNSNGGYIWNMNADFDNNTSAKEAFTRAFVSWRCGTFVKWELGSSTVTDTTARDGTNIIRFDNGSELPAGVLGSCYIYYSGCGIGTNMTWFVDELDIVFDDATNWNFGISSPLLNQIDFESVVLHELGHGHQLGHVVSNNEVMHYSIGAGQSKRTLSTNDINGGNYVMNRSTSSGACLNDPMIALDASNCSGTSAVAGVSVALTNGSNPACEGASLTFTASATNGGSSPGYQWKINGNNAGTNSSTFTSSSIQNEDKISCIMTSSMPGVTGSPATSNEINMSIHSKPPRPEVIPQGQDSLTSSVAGTTYQWYFDGTPLSGSNKTIKPVLIGYYTVAITDSNNCVSDISEDYLYPPVGLNENHEKLEINIFPNPTQGIFTIEIDETYAGNTEIIVSNLLGRVIYESKGTTGNRKEINLSEQAEGIYFVSVKEGGKIAVQKIIVRNKSL